MSGRIQWWGNDVRAVYVDRTSSGHRSIPDNAPIKEVTLKKATTGEWYVTFGLEIEDNALSEKPEVDDMGGEDCVGIDGGIQNYIYTSDGGSVGWLDLSGERPVAPRTTQSLPQGTRQYQLGKQRQEVAKVIRRVKRQVEHFQHKLTTWLVKEYDAVFVEGLDVAGMLRGRENARNKQDAAWRSFIELLEYKGDLYGAHVVHVNPRRTTRECAECGVETDKPLWVREHSCPSCGFEAKRDANASDNVLSRGLHQLGTGHTGVTTEETATVLRTEGSDGPHENSVLMNAVETDGGSTSSVSASRVVETGSLGA